MLCNPVSYYPQQIDEMIFFQDTDLENMAIMAHYNDLIAQGKYSEANDYIDQQEGIYGFFADFFNLIENRIYTLQSYLLTKEKINPFIFYNDKQYLTVENMSIYSDIDKKEPWDNIRLFSDTDMAESLESILIFKNDNEEDAEPMIYKQIEEIELADTSSNAIWI